MSSKLEVGRGVAEVVKNGPETDAGAEGSKDDAERGRRDAEEVDGRPEVVEGRECPSSLTPLRTTNDHFSFAYFRHQYLP